MPLDKAELAGWIPRLSGRRILVAGDLILDRYVLTAPLRLSREAPVMIAGYEGEVAIPGGAANAIVNLLALGARAVAVGLIGADGDGATLARELAARGADTAALQSVPGLRTICKTRIMVGETNRMKQQVLRIDRDQGVEPDPDMVSGLAEAVLREARDCDAVLLSDYGYGAVDPGIAVRLRAGLPGLTVAVDSRYRVGEFQGVSFATPNEGEAEEAVGFRFRGSEDLDRGGARLREGLGAPALLVTRGNQGMALFEHGRARIDIPAAGSDQVVDVSGAGDTVIAVATLARAAGAPFEAAARLANLAAGVVVSKWGAASCSPEELAAAVERHG
jgi:rfaE bifunctional protein kinase chain/domain